jgi:hypothetical protein
MSDVAQLIEDEQIQLGELALEAQEAPFVPCLDVDGANPVLRMKRALVAR